MPELKRTGKFTLAYREINKELNRLGDELQEEDWLSMEWLLNALYEKGVLSKRTILSIHEVSHFAKNDLHHDEALPQAKVDSMLRRARRLASLLRGTSLLAEHEIFLAIDRGHLPSATCSESSRILRLVSGGRSAS